MVAFSLEGQEGKHAVNLFLFCLSVCLWFDSDMWTGVSYYLFFLAVANASTSTALIFSKQLQKALLLTAYVLVH